jgi:hypothetical protein
MESIFSADFSEVRIHVGSQAECLNAAAFTSGSEIYFAPGRCQFDTLQGLQLLGHELTHVLQQRRAQVTGRGNGLIIVQNRELEMEADRCWFAAAGACGRRTSLLTGHSLRGGCLKLPIAADLSGTGTRLAFSSGGSS